MSPAPSVLKAIAAVRKVMAAPPAKGQDFELFFAVQSLLRKSENIAADADNLRAFLEFAPDLEAFRGKDRQSATQDLSRMTYYVASKVKERLPTSKRDPELFPQAEELPDLEGDVLTCLEMLAVHAFARTQGPPVRSRHAGDLRALAWKALDEITDVLRRPEHLAHALAVAADTRAAVWERRAAIDYLVRYWSGDEPDEATAELLRKLEKDAPDRTFLATVLQAQIELGLNDGLGVMFAVEDWDDAHETD